MTKMSVIVPVYNVQEYIKQCLESIINQTLHDIEILVVDDGSIDNSISIVKQYKDERIRIITKENGGLSSARNAGIKEVKGEYISFIDSDDFLLYDTALEEMYDLAIINNSDVVIGNALEYYSEQHNHPIYRNREVFVESTMNSEELLVNFLKSKSMHAPVWLNIYRSELIVNSTSFKEGILHEDEEFTPRILLKAKNVTVYPNEFYGYRQREGSITNVKNKTKNSLDLINTCVELERLFSNIENEKLKSLYLDYLVGLFLHACYMSKLKELPKNADTKLLIKNSSSIQNYWKSILFNTNKTLYYFINDLTKGSFKGKF
jgi:glycosyltransferase involved in cell wall biosynthesis